jgi:hypothetical protein
VEARDQLDHRFATAVRAHLYLADRVVLLAELEP